MENNLINVQIEERDGLGLVVSSRVVAEGLGKHHRHVIRDIEKIIFRKPKSGFSLNIKQLQGSGTKT